MKAKKGVIVDNVWDCDTFYYVTYHYPNTPREYRGSGLGYCIDKKTHEIFQKPLMEVLHAVSKGKLLTENERKQYE